MREETIFYKIKYKIQTLLYNLKLKSYTWFINRDTWNLDYVIAIFVIPRLKAFKKLNIGFPCNITEEEWHNQIDKMIRAFELIRDWDKIEQSYVKDNYYKLKEEINEGLELFSKNITNLWW